MRKDSVPNILGFTEKCGALLLHNGTRETLADPGGVSEIPQLAYRESLSGSFIEIKGVGEGREKYLEKGEEEARPACAFRRAGGKRDWE